VSIPSVAVVAAALRDPAALRANVTRVTAERARLAAGLASLGAPASPSVTNFLLVGLGDRDRAAAAADRLLGRGLVPRTFGRAHPLADHVRFTVRSPAEDDRLLAALAEILPTLPYPTRSATRETAP
jgi:histidinol-phosphate/aromatic aminotransferase/cobyric acid decarboxylase-like protein